MLKQCYINVISLLGCCGMYCCDNIATLSVLYVALTWHPSRHVILIEHCFNVNKPNSMLKQCYINAICLLGWDSICDTFCVIICTTDMDP